MLPLPSSHHLPGVYDRSGDPSHEDVDGLLFSANRRSQSAELNEMQQYLQRRMDSVASSVFADGDVTEGGTPALLTDVAGKTLRVHKGKVYLKGRFYSFEDTDLNLPLNEVVALGIRYYEQIVDSADDIGLLNPAVHTRGYGEPGAYRVKSHIEWGFKAAGGSTDTGTGEFFPVYSVDNGVVIQENASPMSALIYKALRRYDYDGNGSFVSTGLRVNFISETSDNYFFQVEAGSAHILGDIIDRTSDARLTFSKDPDQLVASNEFHVFNPGGDGRMTIFLSRPPISLVTEIIGQKEKTIAVIRGSASNTTDIIDETIASVVSIVSVSQAGPINYAADDDYTLEGDEISWAPGGTEPGAGESYNVTFRYIDSVGTPESTAARSIVVSGYVAGESLLISYTYKLPRVDSIVIGHDGTISRLKGTPALQNPGTPLAGPNEIALATVEYDWFSAPTIRNVAVRAVHMSDLEDMRANIFDLFRLAAEEKLRNDANQKDPSAKLGVFVDAFKDELQRDSGVSQTAAIVSGFLMLPISAVVLEPNGSTQTSPQLLPYTPIVAIEQQNVTQSMPVNVNGGVAPVGKVVLTPSSDSWSAFASDYTSQLTELIAKNGLIGRLPPADARKQRRKNQLDSSKGAGVEVVSQDVINAELAATTTRGLNLRSKVIAFALTGFQPHELISVAEFDGVSLTPLLGVAASSTGTYTGTFTIPANIPTGIKLFALEGSYGTIAIATYSALFSPAPNPPPVVGYPSVLQTFVPEEDMQVCGAAFKFAQKGSTGEPIFVHLREMVNGFPTTKTLAEGVIAAADMVIVNAHIEPAVMSGLANIRSDHPNTFYGFAGISVGVGDDSIARRLAKFTLPSTLIGAQVFSARLTGKVSGVVGTPLNIKIHRLTQSFDATTATWNNRQLGIAWTNPGGTFVAESADGIAATTGLVDGLVNWNITNIVQQWAGGQANHGIILQAIGEAPGTPNYTNFYSGLTLELVFKQAGGGILGEGWTQVLFPLPAFVHRNTEYALTLFTNDPNHKVFIARLGDMMQAVYNNGRTGLISTPAYPNGMVMEIQSTNYAVSALPPSQFPNSALRPRDDLAFRVLRARYDQLARTVNLGDVNATQASDFLVRGVVSRFTGDTDVTFEVLPPTGPPVTLENNQTLPVPAALEGVFNVKAKLRGTEWLSPILYPNTLTVVGTTQGDGTYISKRIKAAVTFNAAVILKAFLPAGATVSVYVANATYAGGVRVVTSGVHQFTWLEMTLDSTEAIDDGFVEKVWFLTGVKGVTLLNLSQVKLVLHGAPNARLLVKDLQFYTRV